MKQILLVLFLVSALFIGCGKNDEFQTEEDVTGIGHSEQVTAMNGDTLKIKVTDLRNAEGKVLIALFRSEEGYEKKIAYKSLQLQAVKGELEGFMTKLPPGTYGISFFHDENENNELDKSLMGIPSEEFGFSNDAMGSFGPPTWKEITFEYSGEKTVTMKAKSFF